MPAYDTFYIAGVLEQAKNAASLQAKGRLYEELLLHVFSLVPGVSRAQRNILNTFESEEVDVGCWVDDVPGGIGFLLHVLLIECKNWSSPVGSAELNHFGTKLQNRGLRHGVFVAANGITGLTSDIRAAHHAISMWQSRGIRIVVMTTDDLRSLTSTDDLATLIKDKLCQLALYSTALD